MIQFERLGVVLEPDKPKQAKFNPGMLASGGEVHLLYRFCEKKHDVKVIDWSTSKAEFPYKKNYICYAKMNLDGTLKMDTNTPVIVPDSLYESCGCEDPRIVPFEDQFYIFYTAYDNQKARVGVARTKDFHKYEKIGFIDNFTDDKDAFIFPERINGKIAYMHRIPPTIQIDYFDEIDDLFLPESWEDYESRVNEQTVIRGKYSHESIKVGGGIPPIKTDLGWLIIYHGVCAKRQYHIGAALLQLDNPSREIARLPYSLLSPESEFELSGDYLGCVFPQGYFINEGMLYISYGTADKYVAIARIKLETLFRELESNRL